MKEKLREITDGLSTIIPVDIDFENIVEIEAILGTSISSLMETIKTFNLTSRVSDSKLWIASNDSVRMADGISAAHGLLTITKPVSRAIQYKTSELVPTAYYGQADTVPRDDERQAKWKEQRASRGFDDTELWDLGSSIIEYALPRMKAWVALEKEQVLNFRADKYEKMISGLEVLVKNNMITLQLNDEQKTECEKALVDFGRSIPNMWD